MSEVTKYTESIMDLIGKNKMGEALEEMKVLFKGSPEFNEVILHSARLSEVMKQIRMGTVDMEDASVTKNQIRFALMDIVRELEVNYETNDKLKSEFDKFQEDRAVMKTNTVTITGDGNFNIQDIEGGSISINVGNSNNPS